ncbi:MAG: hypothetical protein JXR77_19450 [Lentisphaeria bacterium]|nr:hypothetical protein [Lentisphaeria bacterium]
MASLQERRGNPDRASVESAANDTMMLASFPGLERERTASFPGLERERTASFPGLERERTASFPGGD